MRSRIFFDVASLLALLFSFLMVGGLSADAKQEDKAKKSASTDGEKKEADKAAKKSDTDKDAEHKKGDTDKDADHKKGDSDHKKGEADHEKGDADHKSSGEHTKGDGEHAKGGDGHGEHDAADLGHGFAGPNLETPHEVRTDLAIYSFIVFALLLLILKTFAWGPIVEGLKTREESIAAKIAQAEQNAAAAETRAKEYEAKLSEAAEEARVLVAQARTDAEAARERILSEAEEARKRDRERFLADIEGAKNAAISEVAQHGAEIAISLAGQIVRREINAGDHAQLIQESLERFPSNN